MYALSVYRNPNFIYCSKTRAEIALKKIFYCIYYPLLRWTCWNIAMAFIFWGNRMMVWQKLNNNSNNRAF